MQRPTYVGQTQAGKPHSQRTKMPGRSGAMFCCDLLKALRHDWYTGQRLEKELHIMWSTWKRWSRELDANGLIVRRTRTIMMANNKRRRVVEYALAKQWGGQAHGVGEMP